MSNNAAAQKPLTAQDAADYLGLSISMLYRLLKSGRIRGYQPNGKKWYFMVEDLDAWIKSGASNVTVSDSDRGCESSTHGDK